MAWTPQPGPQTKAIRAARDVQELLYGGAAGGGKTDFLLGDYLQGVSQGACWQGVLFRRTYPELDEIIERSQAIYPLLGGTYRASTPPEWRFPGGACLRLRSIEGAHEFARYQGHSYAWIGWDELPTWVDMSAYHRLKSRLRGPAKGKRIRATGNPGGPGHLAVRDYFRIATCPQGYERHVDPATGMTRMFVPARVTDNKRLLDNDPGYVDRLRGVGDPELVRAWLDGDWEAIVGGYFSQWSRQRVEEEPYRVGGWALYGAMDYGEANPTWFGLLAVDYDDGVHVVAEYYAKDRGAAEHARGIRDMLRSCPWTKDAKGQHRMPAVILADPAMFTKRRTGEPHLDRSPADTFAEHGLHLTPANNDRVAGWRVMKQLLSEGRLRCFSGWTTALVESVPTLQRDPKQPEDVLKGGDDHAADALRYGLVHVYKPARPKVEVKAPGQRVLDQIAELTRGTGGRYAERHP